jgi:hypothetical protein
MTKAEKAEMENLRKARDLARALAWPSYPCPQPMTQEEIKEAMTVDKKMSYGNYVTKVALGWYQNSYNGLIERGWSTTSSHSRSMSDGGAQNMGRMYRTYEDAARALRHEMTVALAEKLASIDRLIELGEPAP